MNAALQELLAAHLPFTGLAAWSARLPDRTVAQQSFVPWLNARQIEQVLARLSLAADGLQHHQFQPVHLCWVFDHMRLYLAVSRNGACLALLVRTQPDLPTVTIEKLLTEFAALTV